MCFTVKPKSAHKWRNYRLSLLWLLLLLYIWWTNRKKIIHNIYIFISHDQQIRCLVSRRRHFTKAIHISVFFFFRLCVFDLYIHINNIRGVITVDEIYGCDNSQHYTFDWHCMRLIKWISTHTHMSCSLRSLCWCEFFLCVWSHSFSFVFTLSRKLVALFQCSYRYVLCVCIVCERQTIVPIEY